jgi:hypothetical protein
MSRISRRNFVTVGLTAAGVSGLGIAAKWAQARTIAPDAGESSTRGEARRTRPIGSSRHAMARGSRGMISSAVRQSMTPLTTISAAAGRRLRTGDSRSRDW